MLYVWFPICFCGCHLNECSQLPTGQALWYVLLCTYVVCTSYVGESRPPRCFQRVLPLGLIVCHKFTGSAGSFPFQSSIIIPTYKLKLYTNYLSIYPFLYFAYIQVPLLYCVQVKIPIFGLILYLKRKENDAHKLTLLSQCWIFSIFSSFKWHQVPCYQAFAVCGTVECLRSSHINYSIS